MLEPPFPSRRAAGRKLASALAPLRCAEAVVLGLPKAGMPVAYEVAEALMLPLDVFVVRRLRAPERPELVMGAVSSGGGFFLNRPVVQATGTTAGLLQLLAKDEITEVARREHSFRGEQPAQAIARRTVFLVDDGLTTAPYMHAALATLRALGPARIIVGLPVTSRSAWHVVSEMADRSVNLVPAESPLDVGRWYIPAEAVDDGDVRQLLELNHQDLSLASEHRALS